MFNSDYVDNEVGGSDPVKAQSFVLNNETPSSYRDAHGPPLSDCVA